MSNSVSTTSTGERLMKRFLDEMLPQALVIDNIRPDWLVNPKTGFQLELDRWYPELKVAFEFQGDQHFTDDPGLPDRVYRDQLKRNLCAAQGINLVSCLAIDLEYQKMRSFLRKAGVEGATELGDVNRLRSLNTQATKYRAELRAKYPEGITQYRRSGTEDRLQRYKELRRSICQENGWKWKGPISNVTRPPKEKKKSKKKNQAPDNVPNNQIPTSRLSSKKKVNLSREELIDRATLRIRKHDDYWYKAVKFLESIGAQSRANLTDRQQEWLSRIEGVLKSREG